ncbi:MAG: hypothetical protein NE328_24070, partial [Lentisphaeraceae bacterium]|nr:hypothetical protein [Lentisphaeraceae bacterium]
RSTDAQYGIMIIAEYAHIALARDYAYFTLEKEGEKDTITFYKLMPETEKIVIEASLFLMENDQ